MTLFKITQHLTRDDQKEVVNSAARTHVGQAHYAGTGPIGTTCRECSYWQHSRTWWDPMGKHAGAPQPSPCLKYRQMMQMPGKKVPHDARSCKYFIPTVNPQPLQRPNRSYDR